MIAEYGWMDGRPPSSRSLSVIMCDVSDSPALFQETSPKTYSPLTMMRPLTVGSQTPSLASHTSQLLRLSSPAGGGRRPKECLSAGLPARVSRGRCWRRCTHPGRAARWWQGFPTPAVSGAATRARSAPCAEAPPPTAAPSWGHAHSLFHKRSEISSLCI